MIAIVNYGMGNLGSLKTRMDKIGIESIITSDHTLIKKSDKIILPGVGHFYKAITEIKKRGLFEFLSEQVLFEKKAILGICLGMQLMAKFSEEGDVEGFGWIDAEVVRFIVKDQIKYKVPHMGWNSLEIKKISSLVSDIRYDDFFYFVHSYHMKCKSTEDVLTTTNYSYQFVSSIEKENIFGTQFHPEKSHMSGEKLLKNFINL